VLTKQEEVLSNLASLDEEEAARAQTARSRWQVSPTYNNTFLGCIWSIHIVFGTPCHVTLQCLPTVQKDRGLMHPHPLSHNCDQAGTFQGFDWQSVPKMALTELERALQEAKEQASELLVQQQQYQQVQQQLLGDLR